MGPGHLQPGGEAAQTRRVNEAEAKDADAATAGGPDVTESTVLQVYQLYRLGWRSHRSVWITSGSEEPSQILTDDPAAVMGAGAG